MTPEYRDIIILDTCRNFVFQKCDIGKVMSSKDYKLSFFEICN